MATYKLTTLSVWASPDITWDGVKVALWTATEANIIVVAACVPTLHPVYEMVHARLRQLRGYGRPAGEMTEVNENPAERSGHGPVVESIKGFWTKQLASIISSISSVSSSSKTTWTGRSSLGQTGSQKTTTHHETIAFRTLEDAAEVVCPPVARLGDDLWVSSRNRVRR